MDNFNQEQLVDYSESPAYILTAEPAETTPPTPPQDNDVIELGRAFDYEGYQVVRREFFAHVNEPALTFNNFKVYVNAACLNRFPHSDYVQAMVNAERKILAIKPCKEEDRDSFLWCTTGSGKRRAKQITGKIFFAMIFSLMNWNPDYRYKLLGKIIHANDETLIAFDLNSTEIYQRIFKEGEKPRVSRVPVFPDGWKGQFGLPYEEHRKSLQVDIFDGYAVYGIRDNTATTNSEATDIVTPGGTGYES